MSYAIFGAGRSGQIARSFLGQWRLICYVDNNKAGEEKDEVPVLSLEEFRQKHGDLPLVIASENFWPELEQDVLRAGIRNYFVFRERDMRDIVKFQPWYALFGKKIYMDYNEILSHYRLEQYKKIAIIGTNEMLPYLLLNIMEQAPESEILGVVDLYHHHADVLGCSVIRWEEAEQQADIFIMNVRPPYDKGLRERLWDEERTYIDLYDIDPLVSAFHHPELVQFKDSHKGKRCFLIGNGPSLRMEDLDMLAEHHEICFGVNRIYKAFPHTKWRPTYYCSIDLSENPEDRAFLQTHEMSAFLADWATSKPWGSAKVARRFPRTHIMHLNSLAWDDSIPMMPKFSFDIAQGVYFGYTVMYNCFALAFYMGFQEIYLLGVDHSIVGQYNDPRNHFAADYISEEEREREADKGGGCYMLDRVDLAFRKAHKAADRAGVRIYNATRGGKLEEFERVDFDALFS